MFFSQPRLQQRERSIEAHFDRASLGGIAATTLSVKQDLSFPFTRNLQPVQFSSKTAGKNWKTAPCSRIKIFVIHMKRGAYRSRFHWLRDHNLKNRVTHSASCRPEYFEYSRHRVSRISAGSACHESPAVRCDQESDTASNRLHRSARTRPDATPLLAAAH